VCLSVSIYVSPIRVSSSTLVACCHPTWTPFCLALNSFKFECFPYFIVAIETRHQLLLCIALHRQLDDTTAIEFSSILISTNILRTIFYGCDNFSSSHLHQTQLINHPLEILHRSYQRCLLLSNGARELSHYL
jgi:hypothetical protein